VSSGGSNYLSSPWKALRYSETSIITHTTGRRYAATLSTSSSEVPGGTIFLHMFCVVQSYLTSHIQPICHRYQVFPVQDIRGPHCARIITIRCDVNFSCLHLGRWRSNCFLRNLRLSTRLDGTSSYSPPEAVTSHRGARVLTPCLSAGHVS
jgi:hypothetical protein